MAELGHNGIGSCNDTNALVSNTAVRPMEEDLDLPLKCTRIKKPARRGEQLRRQTKGKTAKPSVPTMSLTQIKSFLNGWPWNVYAIKSYMDRSKGKQLPNQSNGLLGAIDTSTSADAVTTNNSLQSTPYRLSVSQARGSESTSLTQARGRTKLHVRMQFGNPVANKPKVSPKQATLPPDRKVIEKETDDIVLASDQEAVSEPEHTEKQNESDDENLETQTKEIKGTEGSVQNEETKVNNVIEACEQKSEQNLKVQENKQQEKKEVSDAATQTKKINKIVPKFSSNPPTKSSSHKIKADSQTPTMPPISSATKGLVTIGRQAPTKGENEFPSGRGHRVKRDKNIPEELQFRPKISMPSNKEPTFFIGGFNGVQIVQDALEALGWRRTKDKLDENFKLKWTELKSHINYAAFREGEQLVNHIPNCQLLTNKLGLLNSLQEYERLTTQMNPKGKRPKLRLVDFLPVTYRLDDSKEREQFFSEFRDNDIWICKPTGKNQGRGIYLVRSLEEIKKTLEEHDNEKQQAKSNKPPNRIIQRKKWQNYYDNIVDRVIQRYIMNPLLLDKRKFDIRAYMLIASTVPFLVLYHKGYVRLSMHEYDTNSDNIIAHLTNQFIQKRDPMYKENKEETAWSMDRFNDYINKHVAPKKGLETDWVYNTLTNKMKQIILYSFHSVKARLQTKIGYFELYGLDFMIDEDMKVFLIEMNINPCLAINCEALKEVVPGIVREASYLAIECFEKTRKGRPIMPLQSLRNFTVLYNGSPKVKPAASAPPSAPRQLSASPSRTSQQSRGSSPADTKSTNSVSIGESVIASKSVTPVRRSKSMSPVKERTPIPASGSGATSATLFSITSSDNEQSGSEPLLRRSRNKHRSSVFPCPSPQRGLVPKATSTMPGPGFRKSTFPSLVDSSQPVPRVTQSMSAADPVRLKMTHAGPIPRQIRSRAKGSLDLEDTGLLTATKYSRGS